MGKMYIGPSAARLGLVKSTLIAGEQPLPQLVSLFETKPMLKVLLVPTDKIAIARKNMETEGTIEFLAAQEIIRMNQELRSSERK